MSRLACAAVALGLAALTPGCLMLPLPTSSGAETQPTDGVQTTDWLVSVGARRQLEDLGGRLTKANERLELVDALAFRDAALPDGPSGIDALMTPLARERAAALEVDYVVLVGPPGFRDDAKVNAFLIFLGFYGLAVIGEEARVAAVVLDFERGTLVDGVAARATGKAVLVGFFFGLFLLPFTRSAADGELAEVLADSLGRLHPGRPVRLVLMSVEPRVPARAPPLLGAPPAPAKGAAPSTDS